jgi:hypothetical protein
MHDADEAVIEAMSLLLPNVPTNLAPRPTAKNAA